MRRSKFKFAFTWSDPDSFVPDQHQNQINRVRIGRVMYGWMYPIMFGWMNRPMFGWMNRPMFGWINRLIYSLRNPKGENLCFCSGMRWIVSKNWTAHEFAAEGKKIKSDKRCCPPHPNNGDHFEPIWGCVNWWWQI